MGETDQALEDFYKASEKNPKNLAPIVEIAKMMALRKEEHEFYRVLTEVLRKGYPVWEEEDFFNPAFNYFASDQKFQDLIQQFRLNGA